MIPVHSNNALVVSSMRTLLCFAGVDSPSKARANADAPDTLKLEYFIRSNILV